MVELGAGHVGERPEDDVADGMDEDVQPAVAFDDRVDELPHVLLVADVGLVDASRELGLERGRLRLGAEPHGVDAPPVLRKGTRDLTADATRRSGDQTHRGPTLENAHLHPHMVAGGRGATPAGRRLRPPPPRRSGPALALAPCKTRDGRHLSDEDGERRSDLARPPATLSGPTPDPGAP